MHKFSDSPAQNWENPVLFIEKSLKRCSSLHFHMDVKWPFPRQKSLLCVPSGTTPHWMYQRAAFQQDSRMIPFHGQPQTIKCLKPCFHRRWMEPIIPLLPPQILPSTKSHQQNATHLDYTVPHPSKHLTKLDLTKVSWFSWWVKKNFYSFYETDGHYPFCN